MSEYVNKSLTLPEVFDKVRNLDGSNEDKAKLLLKYDSNHLRWFVDVAYNAPLDGIVIPEYKASIHQIGNTFMSIPNCMTKIERVFSFKNDPDSVKMLKNVLQNVHKDEAQLIVDLLSNKKVRGISKGVFKLAYPQFFPERVQEGILSFLDEEEDEQE